MALVCQIISELITQLGIHHLSAMHFHAESSPLLSLLYIFTYHAIPSTFWDVCHHRVRITNALLIPCLSARSLPAVMHGHVPSGWFMTW